MEPETEIMQQSKRWKKGCLILIGIVAAVVFFMWILKAEAASAKEPAPYNCAVTKKPSTPDYVWYKYPSAKHPKRDAWNNGRVQLIWEDSFRAHEVEIRYRQVGTKKWRYKNTPDDASKWFYGLKNGVQYQFEVRGTSNCGKSKWRSENRIKA